jgi:hypothetical protein
LVALEGSGDTCGGQSAAHGGERDDLMGKRHPFGSSFFVCLWESQRLFASFFFEGLLGC